MAAKPHVVVAGGRCAGLEIPGLAGHGATIWTPEQMRGLRQSVERIVSRGKAGTRMGDGGDFPVKQAFLAFLQADAAAESIVADVRGAAAPKVTFDPVSMPPGQ